MRVYLMPIPFRHSPTPAILATYDGVRFSGVALGAYSCAALYRRPTACPANLGADRLGRSALKGAVISQLATKHSRRRVSQLFRRSTPVWHGNRINRGRHIILKELIGRRKPSFKVGRTVTADDSLPEAPAWGLELVAPGPNFRTPVRDQQPACSFLPPQSRSKK